MFVFTACAQMCRQLVELHLDNNEFEDAGAASLALALPVCTSLRAVVTILFCVAVLHHCIVLCVCVCVCSVVAECGVRTECTVIREIIANH